MQYRAVEHQHWKHPRKAPPLSTVVQPEAPSWGDLEMAIITEMATLTRIL